MIHSIAPIRVRYAETDRMGVVHHANYFVWFEMARILLLDQLGMPYRDIEKRGLLLPVLAANADYKRPARFDDRLEVHLFMRERARARFRFDYEVRRDDTLLATGETLHAFMDGRGKGLRPPEDFLALLHEAWEIGAKGDSAENGKPGAE